MMNPIDFVRTCLVGTALAVTVTVAPALATTKLLDFESTGSPSEITTGEKSEVQAVNTGTKVVVQSFAFGTGKEGAVPKSGAMDLKSTDIGSKTVGAGAGKVSATAEALSVTVGAEAMEKLFTLASSGKTIPHVRLLIYRDAKGGGSIPLYSALMSDVKIVSASWTGTADKPTDKVTLDYASIEIMKNTKADALDPKTVGGSWNRVENKSDLVNAGP